MKSDVFASRKTERWLAGTNKKTEMGCKIKKSKVEQKSEVKTVYWKQFYLFTCFRLHFGLVSGNFNINDSIIIKVMINMTN